VKTIGICLREDIGPGMMSRRPGGMDRVSGVLLLTSAVGVVTSQFRFKLKVPTALPQLVAWVRTYVRNRGVRVGR
jgi:hypothetical protein